MNIITKGAALILRAINHKLREDIMNYLREKEEVTVTELFVHFRLEQSVVSQHLAILRKSGVVRTRKDGKFIYYSLNECRLNKINELSQDIIDASKAITEIEAPNVKKKVKPQSVTGQAY